MIRHIYDTFEHLRDWRSLAVFAQQFPAYAEAIHRAGAPMRNIVGFVDGKLQHLARPGFYQHVLYNGNDRVHGFKWQGLMLPNGMQPFPFGPICGSNHDSFMLRESRLLEAMARISSYLGWAYAFYGDLAYPHDRFLYRPYDQPPSGSWEVCRAAPQKPPCPAVNSKLVRRVSLGRRPSATRPLGLCA